MALSKSWKKIYQNQMLGRFKSRYKHAAYAIVIPLLKKELFPGIQYPRVPGHEIAGIMDEVGTDVTQWKSG